MNQRLVPLLLLLSSTVVSLACPTRTIAIDGGSSGPDGGASGGRAGVGGGVGGPSSTGTGGGPGTGGRNSQAGAGGSDIGGQSAGGSGLGGNGGAGGGSSSGTGGSLATDGTGSQAGAGGSGTGGIAGGGGTTTCADTTSDSSNCGTCGHSCLGGQCSDGYCQPFLLGTVSSATEYGHQTIVSGGKVYVLTGDGPNLPSNVWQTDASSPGAPTEVKTNGIVACVMNGQLFWTAQNQGVYGIVSCAMENCSATTTPIINLMSGQFFECRPAATR